MNEWSTLKKLIWLRGNPATGGGSDPLTTFTGAIVRFFAKKAKPIVKLEANFTPIQDLNGQEAPWPPGGGKNKFDPDSTGHEWVNTNNVIAEQPSAKSVRIPTTAGQTYSLSVKETVSGNVIEICFLDSQDNVLRRWATSISTVRALNNVTAPENTTTLLASISTWSTVSEVQLEVGSQATAFAPYSNICPISGHTGCEVVRTGKNLFDKAAITPNSWIVVNTTTIEPAQNYFVSDYIPVEVGKTIVCTTRGASRSIYYDKNKNPISYFSWSASNLNPQYDGYIRVTDTNDHLDTLQIEIGSTESDYEPYSGTTVSISFGTTVYGGKMTVFEDGSGQIDATMALVDLGTLSWLKVSSNYKSFQGSLAGIKYGYNLTTVMSSSYVGTNGHDASASADCYIWADGSNTVAIKDNSKSEMSASDFKTAMSGVQLCYELATPVTIPLTASQINTLVGENVVWVNDATGDITVQAYGTEIS